MTGGGGGGGGGGPGDGGEAVRAAVHDPIAADEGRTHEVRPVDARAEDVRAPERDPDGLRTREEEVPLARPSNRVLRRKERAVRQPRLQDRDGWGHGLAADAALGRARRGEHRLDVPVVRRGKVHARLQYKPIERTVSIRVEAPVG